MKRIKPPAYPLPVVVQLGFAGSRRLLDTAAFPNVNEAVFLDQVKQHLVERLEQLRTDIALEPRHFLCGISQIAVGADTLFTKACRELAIPQRIFLPQHRDEYLTAIGSDGAPDFPEADKQAALKLLAGEHIIHERMVSDAAERHARFEDANLEIVRVSDVVVCLVRGGSTSRPGGTMEFMERAKAWNKPVLEINVGVKNGKPDFHETWHCRDRFTPPALPPALAEVNSPPTDPPGMLPDGPPYFTAIKNFASKLSKKRSDFFKRAAFIIIGTHVLATFIAVIAYKLSGSFVLPWLLGTEFCLLASGFGVHQYLHNSKAAQTWALARLLAELTRSVLAIGRQHVYLHYLFSLPFPPFIRPLLRTINVLHLRSTAPAGAESWEEIRGRYIKNRLTGPNGQLEFYSNAFMKAERRLNLARGTFIASSITAMLAVLAKLLFAHGSQSPDYGAIFGAPAIILPVLAVAALSLAASFDLGARRLTFKEMHEFLTEQEPLLAKATSEREFAKLLLETESRLLGETVNWYSRCAFTEVA